MGDPAESEQELSSRLGRDAPAQALLAGIRVGWVPTQRIVAAGRTFLYTAQGGVVFTPGVLVCSSLSRSLAGSEVGTPAEHWGHAGSAAAGPVERPLPLADVHADLGDGAPVFGPILHRAAAALGRLVNRHGAVTHLLMPASAAFSVPADSEARTAAFP